MAEVRFAKGSEERQLFIDYCSLCQKYWEPEDNDDYWESLTRDADEFYKKYNTDFAKGLALQLVNEAERKHYMR